MADETASAADAVSALRDAHNRDAPCFAIEEEADDAFSGRCTWRGASVKLETPAVSRADAKQQLAELMLATHGGGSQLVSLGTAKPCATGKNGKLVARIAKRGGTVTLQGKLAAAVRKQGRDATLHICVATTAPRDE